MRDENPRKREISFLLDDLISCKSHKDVLFLFRVPLNRSIPLVRFSVLKIKKAFKIVRQNAALVNRCEKAKLICKLKGLLFKFLNLKDFYARENLSQRFPLWNGK